jgi:hypothetical protein
VHAAKVFASQLSDPAHRKSALNSLISGTAHNDPERAAAALAAATSNLGEEEIRQAFASSTNNISHG